MADEVREIDMWYYELAAPDALVPAAESPSSASVVALAEPLPELNRFLYAGVGDGIAWVDRLHWTLDRWREHLTVEGRTTLLLTSDGVPAGYAELDASAGDGEVEIAYLGLLPWARGRGLGGLLLTEAARRAWSSPRATRVWLHTCELDGPHARRNYERRGFRLTASTTRLQRIPEAMLASSPGRRRAGPEVRLRPMSPREYVAWYPRSIVEFAADKVKSGSWSEAEAEALARADFEHLLPAGAATPGNWLLAIEADGERVGVLWVTEQGEARPGHLFIYDFEIDEGRRRRGYGRLALRALDDLARERGFATIGLHVFGFNDGARSLYREAGYVETGVNMSKGLAE